MVLTEKRSPDACVRRPSSHAASEAHGSFERLFACEYVVAMLCSPLAIGVYGEAIGLDGGNRADMHY
jgi:hypothetical protein